MSSQSQAEMLLQDDNRYVMFPIKSQPVWDMYKKALESGAAKKLICQKILFIGKLNS